MRPRNATMLLALAACSGNVSAGTPAVSNAVKVSLSDVGLESTSLDRTVDPCGDFYEFACGGWIQNNPMPPDKARWGRIGELDESNAASIKSLLDEAAKGSGAGAGMKKLGDFYTACMDEQAIEHAGTGSIKALLDKTTRVKDGKTWMAALTALHRRGRWVVWSDAARPDLKDSSTQVTYLNAAGLGLSDRDYYVNPDFKDKVDAYKLHVSKLLGLVFPMRGTSRADAAAADVLAIETELARLTNNAAENRDVRAAYNPTDLKALRGQVKTVDWNEYFRAVDFEPSTKLVIGTPRLFAQLDKLRSMFKPAQWASYFTFHLIHSTSLALPKAFDDEAFELDKLLTGVVKRKDRRTRCIEATEGALGELLGQHYVTKFFPDSSKQTVGKMVDVIVDVMDDEIGRLDWMVDPTRKATRARLARVVQMIGFPDQWRTYDFDVKRDDFAGNLLRASAFETHRVLAKSGRAVDRGEWQMNAYEVSARYDAAANTLTLPAGTLQSPFFGVDRSVAANFGGIGMVIGHELIHSLDDSGWTRADHARYDDAGACVADMYSTFEAMPKRFVQGRNTLGENLADLGGVKMAFQAYRSSRKDAPKVYIADGFTEDQQFFIAVGQAWCSKDRIEEAQRRLAADSYAPPKFRVDGSLRNLKEFAEAFSCAPGTPMNPAKVCALW